MSRVYPDVLNIKYTGAGKPDSIMFVYVHMCLVFTSFKLQLIPICRQKDYMQKCLYVQ